MSCTSEDLPEPETPVIVTSPRSGKLTVMPLRLFSRALVRMISSGPTFTPSPAARERVGVRAVTLAGIFAFLFAPPPSPALSGILSRAAEEGLKSRCVRVIRSLPNK